MDQPRRWADPLYQAGWALPKPDLKWPERGVIGVIIEPCPRCRHVVACPCGVVRAMQEVRVKAVKS